MAKIFIQNGFPNTNGVGPLLAINILDENIFVGDSLIVNEKIKIPILHILNLESYTVITIPRKYDNPEIGIRLFELFGTILSIEPQ